MDCSLSSSSSTTSVSSEGRPRCSSMRKFVTTTKGAVIVPTAPPTSQTSPPTGYVSVRKGKYGIKNCIFLTWEDAKGIIEKNDSSRSSSSCSEYQIFPTYPEAERYLKKE